MFEENKHNLQLSPQQEKIFELATQYYEDSKYYLKQQNDYRKINRYKKHLEKSRQLLNRANSIVFVND